MFPVLISFFSFFVFSFIFLIFSFVPKTCHPCVLWCGWPCSMPRMPFLPLTGRENENHFCQGRKNKPTHGSGPTASPPKTNLMEQKKLTQQTPVPAVYRSGQERSGQVRKCCFDSSVVQFAGNRLENSGALEGRKWHVARSGILMWKWRLGTSNDGTNHTEGNSEQYHCQHLRHDTTAENSRSAEMVCTQKHSGSEHHVLKSAELLDVEHARLRVQCKDFEDAWKESRTCGRRATAEEVKRGDEADQDTRPLDPSSSSTDPDPKRFKPTIMTNVENLAEQMDEDTSLRTPATSHPLVLDAEENVSKKSRVARNVLYISVVSTS